MRGGRGEEDKPHSSSSEGEEVAPLRAGSMAARNGAAAAAHG
jgi:hypothetical protein